MLRTLKKYRHGFNVWIRANTQEINDAADDPIAILDFFQSEEYQIIARASIGDTSCKFQFIPQCNCFCFRALSTILG